MFELKLKIEKFENIPTHTEKKKKKKEKQIHVGAKEQKRRRKILGKKMKGKQNMRHVILKSIISNKQ